jgi:hypothetical protein
MLCADFDNLPNLAIGDAGQTRYWERNLHSSVDKKSLHNFHSILDCQSYTPLRQSEQSITLSTPSPFNNRRNTFGIVEDQRPSQMVQ